jgi:hypothetical protein
MADKTQGGVSFLSFLFLCILSAFVNHGMEGLCRPCYVILRMVYVIIDTAAAFGAQQIRKLRDPHERRKGYGVNVYTRMTALQIWRKYSIADVLLIYIETLHLQSHFAGVLEVGKGG